MWAIVSVDLKNIYFTCVSKNFFSNTMSNLCTKKKINTYVIKFKFSGDEKNVFSMIIKLTNIKKNFYTSYQVIIQKEMIILTQNKKSLIFF